MSETETPRRRRRRPDAQAAPAPGPQETPPALQPAEPQPVTPLRIAASAGTPAWVVSADAIDGAAARRTGKTAPQEKPAEKPKPAAAAAGPARTGAAPGGAKKPAGKRPAPRRKKKRKNRGGALRLALVALAAAAFCALLAVGIRTGGQLLEIKRTLDRGDNVFYGNLSMNGIDLEGLTMEQAAALVKQQVDSRVQNFKITLHAEDGRTWDITAADLGMQYHTADQLDQLWAIGHTGNSRERYAQIRALEENPVALNAPLTYDLSGVNRILTEIKAEVDVPAVSATRVDDDTKWPPFSYTDDVPGQTLDISGLNQQISAMVESITSGTVELKPTRVEANVTRAWLEGQIVRLASYETAIGATSHEGRFTNIRIGTEKFNHLIVRAGETVSFNKVTGKRTEANGFVEAPEIAYGEYVMGVGGGICQVSSTLYNAVVNAGLQVTKRTQHSLPSNYVPKGQDATVSDNRLDFVFRNNTSAPLYFETQYYKKKNYWYTEFVIYGRPDPNGYTYRLESEVREVLPLPEPVYRRDTQMAYVVYTDETHQISKGEEGFIVDVYLVTMNSSGLQISRELQYTDTYKAVAPQYYVGVMEREG